MGSAAGYPMMNPAAPTLDDIDVLAAVHAFVAPFMKCGPVPVFGSTEWVALPDDDLGKFAAVVRAGVSWWHLDVFGAPAGWAERLDRHAAERLKSAAVDLSVELQRERQVLTQRRGELGSALRRGDTRQVAALLDRLSGWQWASENPVVE